MIVFHLFEDDEFLLDARKQCARARVELGEVRLERVVACLELRGRGSLGGVLIINKPPPPPSLSQPLPAALSACFPLAQPHTHLAHEEFELRLVRRLDASRHIAHRIAGRRRELLQLSAWREIGR